MKDKEVCQNWIKILGDLFFTIYMYLVAQTKVNTIQQRTGESCIFQSFATNKPTLPPYTKKLAAERKAAVAYHYPALISNSKLSKTF